MTRSVGIVVPSLVEGGGVPEVARFIAETLDAAPDFEPQLFSIPMSARDEASVRITSPSTWIDNPQVRSGRWEGRDFIHVGAILPEFEFQRFRPRPALTECLKECDLIQVVAGSPAWALVASDVNRPVALQVATLAEVERKQRFGNEGGLVTIWRRMMTRITARLDRRGTRVADRILAENSWMKRTVEDWTAPGSVVLAPPGVDTDLFHPKDSSGSSLPRYILSVGRFDDRRKNVQLLFEAYAALTEKTADSPPLLLVGKNGPRKEDWKHADELGIRQHVEFRKNVPRAQLAELYRDATLFVLSSSEEGLGMVLLEAMASGLPVVSTATAGAREAVEDNKTGLLTPVEDAEALSQAMSCLLRNDRSRREMGRAGRERAERRYSNEAAGERFLESYRELTTDHRYAGSNGQADG